MTGGHLLAFGGLRSTSAVISQNTFICLFVCLFVLAPAAAGDGCLMADAVSDAAPLPAAVAATGCAGPL